MSDVEEAGRCLNCNAPLHGPFCGGCGQRAVPPNPTVRELAGDAWEELTGYDGRIMATLRGLARPGFLTREYLAGRRAHYLPPVRVYLVVSVLYFVLAASAPNLGEGPSADAERGRVRVSLTSGSDRLELSDEDRKEILAQAERSPWFLKPILTSVAEDPGGFRSRMLTITPRVFFALVPVFAALVALFYRRRHFPTSLVFAVHLHVFAFVVFALAEVIKFTYSAVLSAVAGLILLMVFIVYALRSFRAVFGGSWPVTLAKTSAIALAYAVASIPAFALILVWASFR